MESLVLNAWRRFDALEAVGPDSKAVLEAWMAALEAWMPFKP